MPFICRLTPKVRQRPSFGPSDRQNYTTYGGNSMEAKGKASTRMIRAPVKAYNGSVERRNSMRRTRTILLSGCIGILVLGGGFAWNRATMVRAQNPSVSTTLNANNIPFTPSSPTAGTIGAATAIAHAQSVAGSHWNTRGPITTRFGIVSLPLYHGPAWIVTVPNVAIPVAGPALPHGAPITSHSSQGSLNVIVNAQTGQPLESVSQSTISSSDSSP